MSVRVISSRRTLTSVALWACVAAASDSQAGSAPVSTMPPVYHQLRIACTDEAADLVKCMEVMVSKPLTAECYEADAAASCLTDELQRCHTRNPEMGSREGVVVALEDADHRVGLVRMLRGCADTEVTTSFADIMATIQRNTAVSSKAISTVAVDSGIAAPVGDAPAESATQAEPITSTPSTVSYSTETVVPPVDPDTPEQEVKLPKLPSLLPDVYYDLLRECYVEAFDFTGCVGGLMANPMAATCPQIGTASRCLGSVLLRCNSRVPGLGGKRNVPQVMADVREKLGFIIMLKGCNEDIGKAIADAAATVEANTSPESDSVSVPRQPTNATRAPVFAPLPPLPAIIPPFYAGLLTACRPEALPIVGCVGGLLSDPINANCPAINTSFWCLSDVLGRCKERDEDVGTRPNVTEALRDIWHKRVLVSALKGCDGTDFERLDRTVARIGGPGALTGLEFVDVSAAASFNIAMMIVAAVIVNVLAY